MDEAPPFDRSIYDAEMQKFNGTSLHVASMLENGDINVTTSGTSIEGMKFDGYSKVLNTEPDYEQAKAEFKVFRPGDITRTQKRFINGVWIIETEESFNRNDKRSSSENSVEENPDDCPDQASREKSRTIREKRHHE